MLLFRSHFQAKAHRSFPVLRVDMFLPKIRFFQPAPDRVTQQALRLLHIDGPYRELTSMADISAGTGLGSSGSFTPALLKALHTYSKNLVHPQELAEQA